MDTIIRFAGSITKRQPRFTRTSIGCWIDSVFGLHHAMMKLACMINDCTDGPGFETHGYYYSVLPEIVEILKTGNAQKLSDDHFEFDIALEYLSDHTATGLSWVWEDGNLFLTRDLFK